MDNLKSALKKHYNDIELTPKQLERLNQTTIKQETINKIKPIKFFNIRNSMAASVVVFSCLFGFIQFKQPSFLAISEEIAYNHNSQMQMEIKSNSLLDIQTYLNRLDFKLIKSEYFLEGNWELLGGRYCSISGKIAAQLRIKNKDTNEVYTYYQASNEFKPKQEMAFAVDGVNVELWQEKGLLMGLAL